MSIKRIIVNGEEHKLDYTALDNLPDLDSLLAEKQDTLDFDSEPTENSMNLLTSGGIYSALQNLPGGSGGGSTTVDTYPTEGSSDPVSSDGVYTALQDTIDNIDESIDTVRSELQGSIDQLESSLANKVNAEQGKGLSTNDFTDTYKNILTRQTPGLLPVVDGNRNWHWVLAVESTGIWTAMPITQIVPAAESEEF